MEYPSETVQGATEDTKVKLGRKDRTNVELALYNGRNSGSHGTWGLCPSLPLT